MQHIFSFPRVQPDLVLNIRTKPNMSLKKKKKNATAGHMKQGNKYRAVWIKTYINHELI